MSGLVVAALFWLLIHLGVAGSPLRAALVARIGANGFRALFSTLSAIGLAGLIWSYGAARSSGENAVLWRPPPWIDWITVIGMLPVLLLFVGAVTVRNPTAVGAERALAEPEPAKGMLRVTRHPMLMAFAGWAILHLLPNGDLASALLFGAIAVVAIAGTFSIDRKRATAMPGDWPRYRAATSVLPFAAIIAGRNRLAWDEIGWSRAAVAVVAWVVLIALHRMVIGVPALPG
jgi:uncharacterized membrane protein